MTYMWNLKNNTNQLIYKTKADSQTENRLVIDKGEGVEGGMEWEFGISRCKLLYTEWINNKVPLYSTGNYIQYLLIHHNGKEYKKKNAYITESLFCAAEINTTL